ncbi:phosphoenolpyruvate--protein phosphotransferase [Paenibacillus sp. S150]|uniref:phosphoenolpyruvate--protein phosphotransferase n=1 Tax=Paenibacillus sp. S150 TaxID=2749826 RepID=UPI001C576834|nr:phosphoenolpyruvate--protein phosphotransferase [Paenibacillus sp. S150]MBW4081431.1 phosphoenolpyruvate--protein phosphotransferase [Paenibacillus sp. S150]
MTLRKLQGIGASTGIAIARAHRLASAEPVIEKASKPGTEEELARFAAAVHLAGIQVRELMALTAEKLGEAEAKIFEAHLLVLDDPELLGSVRELIVAQGATAEYALREVAREITASFEALNTEYLRERAGDIRDVTQRIMAVLSGAVTGSQPIEQAVIIVAHDLTPSDTVQLNREYVKGFTTEMGGITSHSAIMARSMEIPAVVGMADALQEVRHNDLLILDGEAGELLVNPPAGIVAEYEAKLLEAERRKENRALLAAQPTISLDGHRIELAGNIGSPGDVAAVLRHGGEGIGLFRTEFLYMGREELPSEEEQFMAYRSVLEQMEGKPVVVRTIDVGGDKELPCLELPKEDNPFLGFRAIRLCLETPEQVLFRTQLRALLRAGVYGNLKIMFPMIATLEELRRAKSILAEEKLKLEQAGIPAGTPISVGMMVEIPAAAVMADLFAPEVDFFSIGTNDLIQYTMAADRMNSRVSYLYQPYNPAVLRLIKQVIDAAHRQGKWAGMCGEMAGSLAAIPLLLGLGLDEFSMSAPSILAARDSIRQLSHKEMEELARRALSLGSAEEVKALLEQADGWSAGLQAAAPQVP